MTERASLAVRGDRIAASCCFRLLARAGLSATWNRNRRARIPALMLSESSQRLLADIWEHVIATRPHASGRMGPACPAALSRSCGCGGFRGGILARLHQDLRPATDPASCPAEWTLLASGPLPEFVEDLQFGSRIATASSAKLKAGAPAEACWIESVDEGWLFLVPGGESAWLFSIGSPAADLLPKSRLIANQIASVLEAESEFPSYPASPTPSVPPGGWLVEQPL